jgi:uncharacterized protein (DUF924 family)
MNERAKAVLNFWFIESLPEQWFSKNESFDNKIKEKFLNDYEKAKNNKLDNWQNNPQDCLALIILLDQFSRNLFRDNSQAFATDRKARHIANKAFDKGYLKNYSLNEIHFMILPLMHSENISDHDYWKKLSNMYLKEHPNYKTIKEFADRHYYIINKFGRYPHRNLALGRISTKEEIEFLKKPNSSF